MWKNIISYLPDWTVFVQGFIVFLVPFVISEIVAWIRTSKDDS